MKHINTFKLFEAWWNYNSKKDDQPVTPKEMISTYNRIAIRKYLNDILLEIEDIGYNHYIGIYNDQVEIEITKPKMVNSQDGGFTEYQEFEYAEVKDCLWSCIDYMNSVGYEVYYFVCEIPAHDNPYLVINNEHQDVNELTVSIKIKFKESREASLRSPTKNDRNSV
jgi:hypothetical protein